jgi:hypothetical protein
MRQRYGMLLLQILVGVVKKMDEKWVGKAISRWIP